MDSHAPRMKRAMFTKHVITKELWKQFREKFPEYKDKTDQELFDRWLEIAETIRNEVVNNPLGVKLGSYLGELKLLYLPYRPVVINEKVSEELGEEIPQVNLVTKGKVAVVKWERRWAVNFNNILPFFGFNVARKLKIMTKPHIISNPSSLRVGRSIMGGSKTWRERKKNY